MTTTFIVVLASRGRLPKDFNQHTPLKRKDRYALIYSNGPIFREAEFEKIGIRKRFDSSKMSGARPHRSETSFMLHGLTENTGRYAVYYPLEVSDGTQFLEC